MDKCIFDLDFYFAGEGGFTYELNFGIRPILRRALRGRDDKEESPLGFHAADWCMTVYLWLLDSGDSLTTSESDLAQRAMY